MNKFENVEISLLIQIQIHKRCSSAARQVSQRLLIVWGELKWDESVPQTSDDRL